MPDGASGKAAAKGAAIGAARESSAARRANSRRECDFQSGGTLASEKREERVESEATETGQERQRCSERHRERTVEAGERGRCPILGRVWVHPGLFRKECAND